VTDIDMTDVTLAPPRTGASRLQRLTSGVRDLKVGRGRIGMGEHTLMLLGGIIAPLGLVIVLIGWYGAARTPNLFEQVPYLISGGLFGLALVILGGFLYFAHWLTELIKETRAQANVVAQALERLEETMARQATLAAATVASAPAGRRQLVAERPAPTGLVATAKGTMAHRPDCVVVAGKDGLRAVEAGEDLQPCKLCDSGEEL
jgi:multisubunit Na+/H+ antiporter MnhG subunit